MDKNTISFIVLCISIVLIIFGVYSYNNKKYDELSTMVVLPIKETYSSEYISTTIKNVETYITTKPISTTSTIINTTTTNIDKVTTSTSDTTTSTKKTTKSNASSTSISFPISLNVITCEELTYINGIGTATAQKIIDYRNSIGYFTSRYQLLEINGIGESKMNTIMQYTYIENEDLNYNNSDNNVDYPLENDNLYYNNEDYQQIEEDIQSTVQYPINLNVATLEELCLIPNVDINMAQEIISLRDTIQYFSSTYELLYVNGVSEDFLNQIIDYISVE